jgi:hypothetical protein
MVPLGGHPVVCTSFENGAAYGAFAYIAGALARPPLVQVAEAGGSQFSRGYLPSCSGCASGAAVSEDWIIDALVLPITGSVRALFFAGEEAVEIATTTVGRWMSQSELEAMQATGRVQESFGNGVTSVTVPPNPTLYRAAPTGDIFTQFDVPASSLRAVGSDTGKIYGPNSIFGPRLGITEMPPATNIRVP